MARPKEFLRETALQNAVAVFSEHGFEGTSTDALLSAMGISRQSMYDTFGDKWQLYLEALRRYTADSVGEQLRVLNTAVDGFRGIADVLDYMIDKATKNPSVTCLGVSAVCEFGREKIEIAMLTDTAQMTLISTLERRIGEAKLAGQIRADVEPLEAANFLVAILVSIRVSARGGADSETLRGIARMALRSMI